MPSRRRAMREACSSIARDRPDVISPGIRLGILAGQSGGALFVVTANAWAMAVIVFMTPQVRHGANLGANLADYVLQWSLPVILPVSLPVLILGMWFLVSSVDLGRIRRPWVRNSVGVILVVGTILALAISVSIVAAWFAFYVERR